MFGYMIPAPPTVSGKGTPVAHDADATLALADMGKIHTNTGAGAGKVLTLPAASDCAGHGFKMQITAAQTITLDPGTGKIWLGGSGVADKYALIAGVIGNYANVHSDGVDWIVDGYSGVVTKEA